jgi:cation transport ATPase
MSETEDLKQKLRELEQRMSEVSKKLDDVLNTTREMQGKYEKSEKLEEDKKSREKNEWQLFKWSLLISSIMGVATGFFISYLTKFNEALSTPSWTWALSAWAIFFVYLVMLLLIWKMPRPRNLL